MDERFDHLRLYIIMGALNGIGAASLAPYTPTWATAAQGFVAFALLAFALVVVAELRQSARS